MALKSKGNKNRIAGRDYYEKPNIEHQEVHVHSRLVNEWTPHLVSCPHCNARISYQAATCPACHAPIEKQRQKNAAREKEKTRLQITIVGLLLFALGVLFEQYIVKPDPLIAGLIHLLSKITFVVCLVGAAVAWVRLKML